MEQNLTNAKRAIGTAETCLFKADREWAYYKNGSPYPIGAVENDTTQTHYLKSQRSYAKALEFALKGIEILKDIKDDSKTSLENRAQKVIDKSNRDK